MNEPIGVRPLPRQAKTVRAATAGDRVWRFVLPLLAGTANMIAGIALRLPIRNYTGADTQSAFNNYVFQHLGAYSDIASLWYRDQMWNHGMPFFEYQIEYPVLMGLVIWLLGFAAREIWTYFLVSAAAMAVCGVVLLWLTQRYPGANVWLLALSPALGLYVALNWDMFSVLLTAGALLLFRRDRDRWGALLLSTAVWAKFFPIVLVPLVIFERLLRRRVRDAIWIGGIFAAATVLYNAPAAIERTATGWQLRESWLFFFRFNSQRGREVNFWNFFDRFQLSLETINFWSAALLGLGIMAITLVIWRGWLHAARRPADLILPAALAAVAWFFFINKVYSPQYSLWLVALLALIAAPTALVVAFAGVDLLYFAASFIILHLSSSGNPASQWFFDQALIPSMALREAAILAIVVFALARLWRGGLTWPSPPSPLSRADAQEKGN